MKASLCSLAVSMLLSVQMLGAVIASDFQSDGVNQTPAGAVVTGTVKVVDAGSVPSDPFNKPGNHSLLIEKTLAGSTVPRATWSFADTQSGILTFTAFSYSDATYATPLLTIFLVQDSTLNIGVRVYFKGTTAYVRDGATDLSVANALTLNTANEISIRYSDQTYSLYINGALFTTDTGKSEFAFESTVTNINAVQFATADSKVAGSRVFIDSFAVEPIPEPTTLSMLVGSCVAGAALLRYRKKHGASSTASCL